MHPNQYRASQSWVDTEYSRFVFQQKLFVSQGKELKTVLLLQVDMGVGKGAII